MTTKEELTSKSKIEYVGFSNKEIIELKNAIPKQLIRQKVENLKGQISNLYSYAENECEYDDIIGLIDEQFKEFLE